MEVIFYSLEKSVLELPENSTFVYTRSIPEYNIQKGFFVGNSEARYFTENSNEIYPINTDKGRVYVSFEESVLNLMAYATNLHMKKIETSLRQELNQKETELQNQRYKVMELAEAKRKIEKLNDERGEYFHKIDKFKRSSVFKRIMMAIKGLIDD